MQVQLEKRILPSTQRHDADAYIICRGECGLREHADGCDRKFLEIQYRKLGGWSDSSLQLATNDIDLTQDFDNVIEVRAVDNAGNRPAAQIGVEENSSLFCRRILRLNRSATAATAILKDIGGAVNLSTRVECSFHRIPKIALLDLNTYRIISFHLHSPGLCHRFGVTMSVQQHP